METMKLFSGGLLGTYLILSTLFWPSLSKPRLPPTSPYNIIQQYLIPHNIQRSKLGLPPLKWSQKLEKYASWWAHQRQGDCSLIHSNSKFGENLFWGSGQDWKPSDAVAAWARERSYYNYKTNSCSHNKDCLHYTQMVWIAPKSNVSVQNTYAPKRRIESSFLQDLNFDHKYFPNVAKKNMKHIFEMLTLGYPGVLEFFFR